jgi:hypothetical protein
MGIQLKHSIQEPLHVKKPNNFPQYDMESIKVWFYDANKSKPRPFGELYGFLYKHSGTRKLVRSLHEVFVLLAVNHDDIEDKSAFDLDYSIAYVDLENAVSTLLATGKLKEWAIDDGQIMAGKTLDIAEHERLDQTTCGWCKTQPCYCNSGWGSSTQNKQTPNKPCKKRALVNSPPTHGVARSTKRTRALEGLEAAAEDGCPDNDNDDHDYEDHGNDDNEQGEWNNDDESATLA